MLITTPIFYVNAAPHVGHASTLLLADALARWHRLCGRSVLLATGTDEHGTKVARAAAAAGEEPKVFCDRVSGTFRALAERLQVSHDVFLRTTSADHAACVARMWEQLDAAGWLARSRYEGYYSASDEAFVKDVVATPRGMTARDSGADVEWQSESNYAFALGRLAERVRAWAAQPGTIVPASRQTEVLATVFDDATLRSTAELSVSRPSVRAPWGVPVPGDPTQTVYVWLDALCIYLTAAGYGAADGRHAQWWPPTIQVVGKDIARFHALYWPAFLLACGLSPPRHLLIHGHWTVDGRKMSKSVGNVVDPMDLAARYGVEAVRWFLLSETSQGADANFTEVELRDKVHAELADTWGNLVRRCTAASLNPSRAVPPRAPGPSRNHVLHSLSARVHGALDAMDVRGAAGACMEACREANRLFDHGQPWTLPEPERRPLLADSLETVRCVATAMQALLPGSSGRILDALGVPATQRTAAHIADGAVGNSMAGRDLRAFDSFLVYDKRKGVVQAHL